VTGEGPWTPVERARLAAERDAVMHLVALQLAELAQHLGTMTQVSMPHLRRLLTILADDAHALSSGDRDAWSIVRSRQQATMLMIWNLPRPGETWPAGLLDRAGEDRDPVGAGGRQVPPAADVDVDQAAGENGAAGVASLDQVTQLEAAAAMVAGDPTFAAQLAARAAAEEAEDLIQDSRLAAVPYEVSAAGRAAAEHARTDSRPPVEEDQADSQ
jgi:hypothetical protein